MLRSYQAILKGSQLEWVGEVPEYDSELPLNVQVTIPSESLPSNLPSQGQQMAEILEHLANNGAFSEIEDPVSWQRSERKDRKEMEDIQSYVEAIRKRDSHHPDGRLKTPEEFLHELEAWNE